MAEDPSPGILSSVWFALAAAAVLMATGILLKVHLVHSPESFIGTFAMSAGFTGGGCLVGSAIRRHNLRKAQSRG